MSDEIDYRKLAKELYEDVIPLIEQVLIKKNQGILREAHNIVNEEKVRMLKMESFCRYVLNDATANKLLKHAARDLLK